MARIIVKSGYIKGKKYKEYYVRYIATRDGVETIKSDYGDKPATKKQKLLIHQLMKDYPSSKELFEYVDFKENSTRENASELISSVLDQNIYDVATKENYVDYIAHRPNVEKLGEHGLFSIDGSNVNLEEVIQEVGEHEGNVWTHIISIKREDATRLNYDHADSWMHLCQAKANELAKAMKVNPAHFRWYAAFHNEGHHPHIHMVAYSTDLKEGFVTKQGINEIRRMFGNEIFHQDLMQIYDKQTKARDELKQYSQKKVSQLLSGLDGLQEPSHAIFQSCRKLMESLKDYHGRAYYVYLPNEAKQYVIEIIQELEKDETVHNLYQQWQHYRQEILHTYQDAIEERLPLFQQKAFKGIKNIIVQEVLKMRDHVIFPDENDHDATVDDSILFHDEKITDLTNEQLEIHSQNYQMKWTDNYKQGVAMFYGGEEEQNLEQAKVLLERECDYNNVLGYSMMAKWFEVHGDETKRDEMYQKAMNGFEDLLMSNPEDDFVQTYCHYRLGKHYLYGMGTDVDYKEAFLHFQDCEDNPYALYSLGTMYQRGLGVEQDDTKAFYYFQRSADKNVYGAYETARHLETGIGCEIDKEEADKYYKNCYQRFLRMISKREDDNLLYRLGMMSYQGKGCQADPESSKIYLQKAVEMKNQNSKILLAKIYLETDDFEHIHEAIQWLEESNDPINHYMLGKEYQEGNHIEQDLKQALFHFRQCENPFSWYRMSQIYEELEDMDSSIVYLRKAVDDGYDPAIIKLASYLLDGSVVDKDIEEAITLLKQADEHDHAYAQYLLGRLFLFGQEVEQDKDLAKEYLTKSAKQGNEYAQYLLDHMDDYHSVSTTLLVSRLLHHISRMFEQQLPNTNNNPLAGVDKKLQSQIIKKKLSMGQKIGH